MKKEDQSLTPKQRRVIPFLLSEATLHAAARKAQMNERSLRRWLEQPAFLRAYRAAARVSVDQTIVLLQQASADAVQNLRTIMNDADRSAPARVAAARATIELAFRGIEIEESSELQRLRDIVTEFEAMLAQNRLDGEGTQHHTRW